MKVQEIMAKDPVVCLPESSLEEVARMMAETDCGSIPVVTSMKQKKPVGMITDRDIAVRAVAPGHHPQKLRAKDFMSSPVFVVKRESSLEECCRLMKEKHVRRLPVVDEKGFCCGIVSQSHIARYGNKELVEGLVKEFSRPRRLVRV